MNCLHAASTALRGHGAFRFSSVVAVIAAIVVSALPASAQNSKAVLDTPNPGGILRTITLDGKPIDMNNPFFQSLGTNGRSCASCHVPNTGWTISPAEVQDRFNKTSGLDPIFRLNDGANSPAADVSTLAARRDAYSMVMNKGNIRVGLPIPAGAEFELSAVEDPYGFASASELSLFRRPLPTTNIRFLTAVMWDGRESFAPMGTTPISDDCTPSEHAEALLNNLMHQSNEATTGHAEGLPLNPAQRTAIAQFQLNLATAQMTGRSTGILSSKTILGGPHNLAAQNFFVTINDVLGADVQTGKFEPHAMTLFDAWAASKNPEQAAIARGAKLFGTKPIQITGVGGLNDDLAIPALTGSCTTCHDSPNVGNHSVSLPIDIGLTDASRRSSDMPLYTLRNLTTGETRQTTDPGRALLTGRWKDIGKFKGPVLRALASRAPYFHDGSAADFDDVLDFYDTRFGIGLTPRERADLIAFLNAL